MSRTGGGALATTDDSTAAPTLEPPYVAPDLTSPPLMYSRLAAYLQAKLCLLQVHASSLAYLLRSNQDRQAFVTTALATLHSDDPIGPSHVPPIDVDSS